MILDVGCGGEPKGYVNTDLFFDEMPHHRYAIKARETLNFVRCDAHYLPFRRDSFNILFSRHVLEHLTNPFKALNGFKKVSKYSYLVVPNNPITKEHPEHLSSWGVESFENLLSKIYDDVTVWERCAVKSLETRKIFRISKNIPLLGPFFTRFLSQFLGLELDAFCR